MSEPLDIEALKAILPAARRALPCLALELPKAVYDDVRDKFDEILRALPSLLSAYEERDRLREALRQIADPTVWDEMGDDGTLHTIVYPDTYDAQGIARAALAAGPFGGDREERKEDG